MWCLIYCSLAVQVVAGEYELKETNVNWSPEDFESKLQVRPIYRWSLLQVYVYVRAGLGSLWYCYINVYFVLVACSNFNIFFCGWQYHTLHNRLKSVQHQFLSPENYNILDIQLSHINSIFTDRKLWSRHIRELLRQQQISVIWKRVQSKIPAEHSIWTIILFIL